jgi:phage baseplate assembly protein W
MTRTPTRLSALRFAHPDLDDAANPGFLAGGSGALALASDHAAIRQSLLLLLSTLPGERVRRPDYGCDLHHLMFSPNDATTQGLAIHYVTQAVRRWEPRIDITALDATADPGDPAIMVLTLSYMIRASGVEDGVRMAFDLASGVQ